MFQTPSHMSLKNILNFENQHHPSLAFAMLFSSQHRFSDKQYGLWVWKAGSMRSSPALPPESCVIWTVFFQVSGLFSRKRGYWTRPDTTLNNNGISYYMSDALPLLFNLQSRPRKWFYQQLYFTEEEMEPQETLTCSSNLASKWKRLDFTQNYLPS